MLSQIFNKKSVVAFLFFGVLNSFAEKEIAPTYLEPSLNGVSWGKPIFRFDFNDLRSPVLGPNRFRFRDFKVQTSTLFFSYSASSKYTYAHVLSFDWPEGFARFGRFFIETMDSQKIFEEQLDEEAYARWAKLKEDIRQKKIPEGMDWNIRKMGVNDQDSFPKGQWGRLFLNKWQYKKFARPFRFCIEDRGEGFEGKMCSPYFISRPSGEVGLKRWRRRNPGGVFVSIDEEPSPRQGKLEVVLNKERQFRAEFDNGMLFEFSRKDAKEYRFSEVSLDQKEKSLRVSGQGEKPGDADWDWEASSPGVRYWVKNYPEKSFGAPRYYWSMKSKASLKSVVVARHGVDRYEVPIEYKKLPPYRAKVYLLKEKSETYDRFPHLRGELKPEMSLRARPPAEIDIEREQASFDWEYYAPEKGRFNRAVLDVELEGEKWKSVYDIYRGYSSEMHLGVSSVVLDSGGVSLQGQAQVNYWLEDLLGWSNSLLSVQRWGVGFAVDQSFSKYSEIANNSEDLSYQSLALNIKYRFSQGLWDRSRTWGLILQNKRLRFSPDAGESLNIGLLGLGVFLAQPATGFFERALNVFSFFRYPKFMDLELLWHVPGGLYAQSGDLDVTRALQLSYGLKVLWTSSFFGKLGLSLDSVQLEGSSNIDFTSLGLRFNLGLNY